MQRYPSKELLATWIDESEPGRRKANAITRRTTDEEKEDAVVGMMTRKGAAQEVAEDMGVKRLALCD